MVDFTNPAMPGGWPGRIPTAGPGSLTIGGAWGSYWYNNFIYETNIPEGLNIFRLRSRVTAGTRRFPFLNSQSQLGRVPVP